MGNKLRTDLSIGDVNVALENKCDGCLGNGFLYERNLKKRKIESIRCTKCGGSGFVFTKLGIDILLFVKKYIQNRNIVDLATNSGSRKY